MLQTVWGWQPALYLFLGGMGAGAFVMAAILYLIDKTKHKHAICLSMWGSTLSLGIGLLLLLSELISPLRGMLMWQSFSHFTTWMTYGAWAAFFALAVFGISSLLATPAIDSALRRAWKYYAARGDSLRRGFAIAGIPLGIFVAVYTGMLLMTAGGVPLWNTPLLPCLFTVSALDTGVALVEVCCVVSSKVEPLAPKAGALMEKIVVTLVVLECIVLAVFLGLTTSADTSTAMGAAAAQSGDMLVSGILAPYFWGMVVVCGLVAPLIAAVAGLAMHGGKAGKPIMFIGAVGALIGGCELRFLILAAGVHADVIASTMQTLLGI